MRTLAPLVMTSLPPLLSVMSAWLCPVVLFVSLPASPRLSLSRFFVPLGFALASPWLHLFSLRFRFRVTSRLVFLSFLASFLLFPPCFSSFCSCFALASPLCSAFRFGVASLLAFLVLLAPLGSCFCFASLALPPRRFLRASFRSCFALPRPPRLVTCDYRNNCNQVTLFVSTTQFCSSPSC